MAADVVPVSPVAATSVAFVDDTVVVAKIGSVVEIETSMPDANVVPIPPVS